MFAIVDYVSGGFVQQAQLCNNWQILAAVEWILLTTRIKCPF